MITQIKNGSQPMLKPAVAASISYPQKTPSHPTTHEFKSVNQPRNAKCAAFAAAEATRTHMAKKKIQKRMKKLKKEAHRMPARMNLLRKSEFMK